MLICKPDRENLERTELPYRESTVTAVMKELC